MRKFHIVSDEHRKHPDKEIKLPVRKTKHSAGYDFCTPIDICIAPESKFLVWTDVKAEMNFDEVLELYIRSSLAIKRNVELKNSVGILDADYFNNEDNDGNIGVCLYNPTRLSIEIKAGEAIAQGIFKKYLTVEDDVCMGERVGGIGSTTNKE